MKICILGAGALGGAIGAALTEGGSEVYLVARSKAHVDAMNAHGLRVRDAKGERTVRVRAALDCSALPVVDLIVVLVKSFDTRAAIAGAGPVIGPGTSVLSLQNGMGHEDILAEAVGAERVLAGKTYVGGVLLGPGHIVAGTAGKSTYIGELDGSSSARVNAIAAVFNAAGLQTTVSRDIVGTMWDKLLVNVATGALSAITRLDYGRLYAVPELKDTAIAAVGEAMAVARAAGATLQFTRPEQAWIRAAEGLPSDFKASMLQSLEKGSPTEIDFVNGAVVRGGARYRVPTPVNSALVACVKGIERAMAASASVGAAA
jgi:2-dehydropantoate 2-reductase